jgi:hypothetical protein
VAKFAVEEAVEQIAAGNVAARALAAKLRDCRAGKLPGLPDKKLSGFPDQDRMPAAARWVRLECARLISSAAIFRRSFKPGRG